MHYGPWERVASLLTEGLVAAGIDVTLFATLDSVTDGARSTACAPHGYAEDPAMDGRVWEALHVAHALARSGEFDLVHNHLDWLPLAFAAHCRAPLVTTVHGFSGRGDPARLPARRDPRSSSISDADRAAELDYVATIHHGIDLDALPFSPDGGDGLVAFGRIHPDKGTADAIAIARRGRPTAGASAASCRTSGTSREQVEPHIDGDRVVYLGSVGPARAGRGARVGAPCCCTRSTSTSRSACRSSRRWRAERPSSPTGAGRCARSSTSA